MNKGINSNNKINKVIYITVFIVSVISSFCVGVYVHTKRHETEIDKYKYLDYSRNFIPKEDYIVNIQPLRDSLNKMVEDQGLSDSVSIYFEVLNTGANISINPQKKIFPASLTKLPLAIAVVKKVDDGMLGWDYKLKINQEDLDQNSGYLYQRGAGVELSIEELIKELLINSDNTAYRILLRNMEITNLTAMVSSLGLEDLFQDDGKMSAKEYTRFFRSLYTSSYLERENSQKILEWMTMSSFDEYLKSGLPNGIKFAHKTGENYLYNSYSDAGIVYIKNRPYMLSVMYETKDKNKTEQEQKEDVIKFMGEVSRKIYEYIKEQ